MSDTTTTEPSEEPRSTRLLTIPNVLCAIRLVGSFVLLFVAGAGEKQIFLWLYVFLAMTDWVDGKLAILLNQRSVFGARLDSWADAALYGSLLLGGMWLHWDILRPELPWVIPAIGTYALSTAAGYWKFGRWPSYHTRLAKTSWFLVLVAALCVLGDVSIWPLRIALLNVTVTNLEAILITWLSPEWRADVISVLVILKERRQAQAGTSPAPPADEPDSEN